MDRPIRLIEMLQLLGGGRPWKPEELAERFGVSERTIFRDLLDLGRLDSIPLKRDEHGYRLVENATLRWLALSPTEYAALELLLRHPAFRSETKLTSRLQQKLDAAARKPQEPPARTLAGPERTGEIAQGLLPLLEETIRERTPVSLLYRSLWSRHEMWRSLDPYSVFHRENIWYLVGHCHVRKELRTFRLDRIAKAERLDGAFEPPTFDVNAFLLQTWNVYKGRTRHEVVIHFDASIKTLIEEGEHHPNERIRKLGNGTLEYRVAISHLEEIARWIVGFAGSARAIEPPALVSRVAEIARLAHDRHREDARTASAEARSQRDLPGLASTGGAASQPDLI